MSASRPWRAAVVAFILFGGLGMALLFGAGLLGMNGARTATHWLAAVRGPWALPASAGAFAILAFLGVPQFILIAAAVAVFGGTPGAAFSWVGTMVSALVGFGLGRLWGARLVSQVAGEKTGRVLDLIARNGFMASLVVRLTPFAPFVVVNLGAGASRIPLVAFSAGTAIGILPKILLTAFAGASIVRGLGGGGWLPMLFLAAAVAVWIICGVLAGRWLRR